MNKSLVKTTCKSSDQLKKSISKIVIDLGGWKKFIRFGDKVLLKPNFNTADPFPASSDPAFIRAVLELCYENGAKKVIIGDSSTITANTRKVMKKLGIFELEKLNPSTQIISFDEGQWEKKIVPNGQYLKNVSVPTILKEVDKIIFLPCLKTHFITKFTGSLKLAVGLMKTSERFRLHAKNTEEKVAELAGVFKPDLVIMDARKIFITKGPMKGDVREPHLILASTDRLALDLEGIKIIQSYEGNSLTGINPEDLGQIKRARELKLCHSKRFQKT